MTTDLLAAAEACTPSFVHAMVHPVAVIRVVADSAAFQGWRCEVCGEPAALAQQLLGRGEGFIVDFGVHTVGQLQLQLAPHPAADAPTRLKLTFGEVLAEIAEPFDPFDHSRGGLSRSWLQDEIINVDVLPQTLTLPRRYAYRYLKVEIIDTSPAYKVRFLDIACRTQSSANPANVPALPASLPEDLRRIDEVSLRTLHNCMQSVFEDGPKRDRRLWLGDLRLQALTNSVSFRNFDLVKRCLLLFAAFPREDGLANADLYEKPRPHRGNCSILDYAALLGPCVLDYLQATGDRQTAELLWPTVRNQLGLLRFVNDDGLFVDPGNWWLFVDWHAQLHKSTAVHGTLLYGFQQTLELARALGRESDVGELERTINRMRSAARRHLLDAGTGLFVSGPAKQISWASQAWMVLAGVVEAEEAAGILRKVQAHPQAVRPAGPYLYHHVVHAMLASGMKSEAIQLIRDYWGQMVQLGATTFWEVFDPANQKLSPYHSHLMNSYCHAWSCTPAWFIRRFLV